MEKKLALWEGQVLANQLFLVLSSELSTHAKAKF